MTTFDTNYHYWFLRTLAACRVLPRIQQPSPSFNLSIPHSGIRDCQPVTEYSSPPLSFYEASGLSMEITTECAFGGFLVLRKLVCEVLEPAMARHSSPPSSPDKPSDFNGYYFEAYLSRFPSLDNIGISRINQ